MLYILPQGKNKNIVSFIFRWKGDVLQCATAQGLNSKKRNLNNEMAENKALYLLSKYLALNSQVLVLRQNARICS